MWIQRSLSNEILSAKKLRPALLVTGARQTGKSSLLRHLFPNTEYITLDRPLLAEEAQSNPQQFLTRFQGGVILDEVQKAPGLFRELKILIDSDRQTTGKWILTGSQKFELMKGLSESLAGRIRILELDTLSASEVRNSLKDQVVHYLMRGGYPELWTNLELDARSFFNDYLATYLERDLRSMLDVSSLSQFERFLRSCALRVGSLLNYSDLARDVGISPATAKVWLHTLEASGIVSLLEPFSTNLSKRLVKAPKLYFRDCGLLAFFLGIESRNDFDRSPIKGVLWENLVFGEIMRHLIRTGRSRSLFFWRNRDSSEVDFLIEGPTMITLIEAKAAEQPDLKSLHFKEVQKTLSSWKFGCQVACLHSEKNSVHLQSCTLWNPLSSDFALAQ